MDPRSGMPTVMIFGSRVDCPCCVSNGVRGSYLSSFLVVAAWGNLSLQYMN